MTTRFALQLRPLSRSVARALTRPHAVPRVLARYQSNNVSTLPPSPPSDAQAASQVIPTPSDTLGASVPPPISTTAPSQPPPRPKRKIPVRLIYTTCFLILGAIFGTAIAGIISPPPFPPPGSPEDLRLLKLLESEIDSLPIVRELRKKSRTEEQLRADAEKTGGVRLVEHQVHERFEDSNSEVKRARPEWRELEIERLRDGSFMKAMSGMGGMGIQRSFWSDDLQSLITVTWIGSALCGWPGVCHGGAIASFFGESAITAIKQSDGHAGGILGAEPQQKSLSITYLKPTNAGSFFVVKSRITDGETATPEASVAGAVARLVPRGLQSGQVKTVESTLEGTDGRVCVKTVTAWRREAVIQSSQHTIMSGHESADLRLQRTYPTRCVRLAEQPTIKDGVRR